MKKYIGIVAIATAALLTGCGGGSASNGLSGDYGGTASKSPTVNIPNVSTTADATVTIHVDSNFNFTATLAYTTTSGGTYDVTFTGNGKNQVQGNSNAFAATETDSGGPFYNQTLEVYYHTYSPTSKYPTGVTLSQYPNGFTQINMYPNGTALPPTSATPSPLWALKVTNVAPGTTTTTPQLAH